MPPRASMRITRRGHLHRDRPEIEVRVSRERTLQAWRLESAAAAVGHHGRDDEANQKSQQGAVGNTSPALKPGSN